MDLLRRLTEKPWLAPGLEPAPEADLGGVRATPAAAVGLRVYFAVATVMFLLIGVIFVMRMGGHGPSAGQQPDWRPMYWPPLLWFNTGVLMLSSLAWEWARAAARAGRRENLRAGLIAGGVCYWACTSLKHRYKYDDTLDVFGIHGIGGLIGTLLTGVFATQAIGGVPGLLEGNPHQVVAQLYGIIVTLVWSGAVTFVILKVISALVPLRVKQEDEVMGLDVSQHGEAIQ